MCMKPTMTEEERILTLEEKVARLQYDVYALQSKMDLMADRKTESNSEIPNNCDTCKHNKLEWYSEVCDGCSKAHSNYEPKTEPQPNADQHIQHVESVEPTWTKEEHEAFYTFLWNVINPNEMEDYIGMFEAKDEPQTDVYEYQSGEWVKPDCPWK